MAMDGHQAHHGVQQGLERSATQSQSSKRRLRALLATA